MIEHRIGELTEEDVAELSKLARVGISKEERAALAKDLNDLAPLVDLLNEVDVTGVEPMTSVRPMRMRMRSDVVTDGGDAEKVLGNAPETADGYFTVPKVIDG
jgi:aspartyl-tRNA(Asn)/glutamyl-tRNA(Gln) amidotransferase subunit C